jgi:LuxR family maltose regulon positive regulatory protein
VSLAEAFEAELDLRQGRRLEALQWARRYDPRPLQAIPRFFVPQHTWLRVLLAEGSEESRSRAGVFLADWQPHVQRLHHTRCEIDTLILRAFWARTEGEGPAAEAALACAVARARLGGVVRPFLDAGPGLMELLDRLTLDGDDAAFAADIRAAFGHDPPAGRARAAGISSLAGDGPLANPLSGRESEVLALLAKRLSNKEIAEQLHITPETVKRHTANVYQKLEVHGRRQAVERAASLGVFRP